MDRAKTLLLFLVGLLAGGAFGYHARPRIVAHTGGTGDETAMLLMLGQCKQQLSEIKHELDHTHQLLSVYQELNEIRKAANLDE
jgi:hypothetical protein